MISIPSELTARVADDAERFAHAAPFPHIVIDDFLPTELAREVYDQFPTVAEMETTYQALNEFKAEQSNFDRLGGPFLKIQPCLSSPELTTNLELLTGIDGLLPDDSQFERGLQEGVDGSCLDILANFNIHTLNNLHRRLNLRVNMNPNWSPVKGGLLELWNTDMSNCDVEVMPAFNRCVIFRTCKTSWHNYRTVHCSDGAPRKLVASYDCMKERPAVETDRKYTTIFKARPDQTATKHVKINLRNRSSNLNNRIVNK